MLDITAEQRRALRSRAHALNPVVAISQNGLSEAVLQEISTSLVSHELIKIRVFNNDREVREQYLATICEKLGAAPVQHIGKLLVIWRPGPDAKPATVRRGRTEARRSKRSFQGATRN
ncbi:YhbY family RNA-binding protein [Propionivibrio sp.]|uniref:YhbY family RNA-binding protein n=1 Tax=Propionivibrio sp. TaxID=2212460 RepID=UPI00262A3EAE|nr:YhbY family RNA-binding protein [Propionivibrio sp.]